MSKKWITLGIVGVGLVGTAVGGLASYIAIRDKKRADEVRALAARDDGTVPFSGDDCDFFLLDLLDRRPDAGPGGLSEAVLLQAIERRYGNGSHAFLSGYVGVALSALRREGLVQKTDSPTGTLWSSVPPKKEEQHNAPSRGWKEQAIAVYRTVVARSKELTSGKEQCR